MRGAADDGVKRYSTSLVRSSNFARVATAFLLMLAACRRESALSTEEIVGEWEKPTRSLPPIDLLITAEGTELRGRLRLSGSESHGRVTVEGRHLTLKFNDTRPAIEGDFVTKNELALRLQPSRAAYVLRKRP